jgi:hypothetical protein
MRSPLVIRSAYGWARRTCLPALWKQQRLGGGGLLRAHRRGMSLAFSKSVKLGPCASRPPSGRHGVARRWPGTCWPGSCWPGSCHQQQTRTPDHRGGSWHRGFLAPRRSGTRRSADCVLTRTCLLEVSPKGSFCLTLLQPTLEPTLSRTGQPHRGTGRRNQEDRRE